MPPFSADYGQFYAILYEGDNELPVGATEPSGISTEVAHAAWAWCRECAEWEGKRRAVILYRNADGDVCHEGDMRVVFADTDTTEGEG